MTTALILVGWFAALGCFLWAALVVQRAFEADVARGIQEDAWAHFLASREVQEFRSALQVQMDAIGTSFAALSMAMGHAAAQIVRAFSTWWEEIPQETKDFVAGGAARSRPEPHLDDQTWTPAQTTRVTPKGLR